MSYKRMIQVCDVPLSLSWTAVRQHFFRQYYLTPFPSKVSLRKDTTMILSGSPDQHFHSFNIQWLKFTDKNKPTLFHTNYFS